MAAVSPVPSAWTRIATTRRKSVTRRCCWRGWRRPWSRATALRARRPRLLPAPVSSSWTTACRMRRSHRISPSRSSTDGEASGAGDAVAAAHGLPIFHGHLQPDPAAIAELKARKVFVFAGIGDPDKFFATATEAGIAVARRQAFPDHHRFSAEEAAELIMRAEHDGLALLTTEKDRARMTGEPLLAALAAKAHVLPVTLAVIEAEELRALLLAKLRR